MLVICEECAKKYNVDESQMKGDKARFTCQKCGHQVVVRRVDAMPLSRGKASVPNSSTSR